MDTMNIKNAKELMNNSESSLDRKVRRLALSGLEAALEDNISEGIVNIPYRVVSTMSNV